MAKSGTPLAAGFGGIALAAMLAGPLSAIHPHGATESPAPPLRSASAETASAANTPNFDANGPWSAICREYLQRENSLEAKPASHDSGPLPGTFVHLQPKEATEDMKAFTVPDKTGVKQLYTVNKHLRANLSACTTTNPKLNVKLLIATVADPHASHMQLLTDRTIDAISLAASAEGYSFSRYWLPWRSAGSSASAPADMDEEAQSRLEEPGILIYRGPVQSDKLLLVFLVGETPTRGINRLQMARALRDTHEIATSSALLRKEPVQPLLIAGPEFSGTYGPLAEVLQASDWVKQACPAEITLISSRTSVQEEIDGFRAKLNKPIVTLVSLSLNESRFEEAVGRELRRRFNIDGEQIAWLSEDETAAGNFEVEAPRKMLSPDDDNYVHTILVPAGKSGLRLKFPRDLSSLRNSGDPGALLLSPAELTGSNPARQGPSLTFAEKASNNFDSPPPFASEQEAIRAASALKSMEERMHERRIQAIVIRASNPLDELYLLDYFRRNLPDIRLVTQDADEFLTVRPLHVSLLGTLVVTGLPLLAGEQDAKTGVPVNLPSGHATGEYVGVRLLLQNAEERAKAIEKLEPEINPYNATGQITSCTGDRCGLPIEDLATFVVGEFGLEPLEGSNLFTQYPIGEIAVSLRAYITPFGTGWLLILTALAALTTWHLLALAGSDRGGEVPDWAYRPLDRTRPETGGSSAFLPLCGLQPGRSHPVRCVRRDRSFTLVLLAPPVSIRSAVDLTGPQPAVTVILLSVNLPLFLCALYQSLWRGWNSDGAAKRSTKPTSDLPLPCHTSFPSAP